MKIIFIVFSTILSLTFALSPGATVSLDLTTLDEAKYALAETILNTIKKVKTKDFEFNGGHLKSNTFSLVDTYSSVDLTLNKNDNSMHVSIKGLKAEFRSESWRQKLSVITARGSSIVRISEVTLNTTLVISSTKLPDVTKYVPDLNI